MNQDKRPPFVRFEMRPKLNPAKSQEEGRQIWDDVAYVIVMQYGSKDEYEKEAQEWIEQKRQEAINGNYPGEWVDRFQQMFEAFKKGSEAPLHGTALAKVPWLTPARIKQWQAANILTLEDMVNANEGVLAMVGMGARTERDQARAYIEAGKDAGAVAAKVGDLEQKLRDRDEMIETLAGKVAELEAAVANKGKKAA